MANILVVEDDADSRLLVQLHLESAHHEVSTARNGAEALSSAKARRPDLIISDVNMPGLDGFGLLNALRADNVSAGVPVVFLTGQVDTETFRKCMQLGADDFVTKPVNRKVLLDAVTGQLKRIEGLRRTSPGAAWNPIETDPIAARRMRREQLHGTGAAGLDTTSHLALGDLQVERPLNAEARTTVDGAVLFTDIRSFTTYAEILSGEESAELLNVFFAAASEAIRLQRGWIVKFLGDGFVAMFEPRSDGVSDHAERALKAALLIVLAAQRVRSWIDKRFGDRGLPQFAVGVGVHCGEVVVCNMGAGANAETTVIGDTVNVASRLESMSKELGWSVVASRVCAAAADGRALLGKAGQVTPRGKTFPVDVVEVTGLAPRPGCAALELQFYDAVAAAVAGNTATVTAARDRAAMAANGRRARSDFGSASHGTLPPVAPDGYRLLGKLGEGGMSQVYLAERPGCPEPQVLKLIPVAHGNLDNAEPVQRFLQEFALVSQISHRNVARIHQQGFTATHAYIAMEHFPRGDLRKRITAGVEAGFAVQALLQIAEALGAIHARGIVHRDMKPDNVMIRADGSLALADFGIAKDVSVLTDQTRHGEVFGTPYYMSPEQALGERVDARSDIYSLGVMFFEMLTGRRPYEAGSPQALLYQHVNSPMPSLPNELARYQPLMERLMAKDRNQRFQSAGALIEFVLDAGPTGKYESRPDADGAPPAATHAKAAYRVAALGFNQTEKIVLDGIFRLSARRAPQYLACDPGDVRAPDAYLVDASDPGAVEKLKWCNALRERPVLMIGEQDHGLNWPLLPRPLQWQDLLLALDRALCLNEAGDSDLRASAPGTTPDGAAACARTQPVQTLRAAA